MWKWLKNNFRAAFYQFYDGLGQIKYCEFIWVAKVLAFRREVLVLTSIILYGIMPIRIIPIGLIGGGNETESIFFW